MVRLLDILQKFFSDKIGGIVTSSLIICAASGVLLAIPFKISDPFNSVSLILIDNPPASFIRNIHYWSAQFFLLFILLHLTDHLYQKSESRVSRRIWALLTCSLPVIFYVMISGFILKGDADGHSAFRILSGLLERIPVAGDLLKFSLMGTGAGFELVYVNHIATASILIIIVAYEHAESIRPAPTGFFIISFIVLLFSFFLQPTFGTETGKGPWYFTGFQEILHNLRQPGWAWILLLIPLAITGIMPYAGNRLNGWLKKCLAAVLSFYIIISLSAFFFRGDNWKFDMPWRNPHISRDLPQLRPLMLRTHEDFGFTERIPRIHGQYEACMVCHDNIEGCGESHKPEAIGCFSCHGGNRNTLDKNSAHRNMFRVPGDLSNADKTCGTVSCHPGIPDRLNQSVMTTMSGVVSVDRFVFGETDNPDILSHIKDIGHSAADQHLRDLCAGCHLGNPKNEPGPVSIIARGGGCNACHLYYSDSATASFKMTGNMREMPSYQHPQLNLSIPDNFCFGCHSRSGRIALNYAGWQETLLNEKELSPDHQYRILEDQRVLQYIGEDVHFKGGMGCTDCHLSAELMGDGHLYAHKEDQVKISCKDCHFNHPPSAKAYADLDQESKKIIGQRGWNTSGIQFLETASGKNVFVNAWIMNDGQGKLRLKQKDSLLVMKSPAEKCRQGKAHESLSCESCHTSWVPSCIGCHNSFDKDADGYDMLTGRQKQGSWTEHVSLFMSSSPTLGIREKENGTREIITFTPGMVISIDTASFGRSGESGQVIFRRLYAPVAAHTTIRKGRSCISCHLDPLLIGYGSGDMVYQQEGNQGKWVFNSRFAENRHDHLPEDAWIGFLEETDNVRSTRSNTRPFNLREQKAILTAGACLLCHKEDSGVIKASLEDFPATLKKVSSRCVLPVWN